MNRKATVLVVEDDEAMRSSLVEDFREAGYEVLFACDGIEALEQLAARDVDVIVTDHQMPAMKGDELLAEVRERNREIPVVIITAFGTIDSAVDAIKSGAFHYVSKPFRTSQLLETVERAVRERGARQELSRYREMFAREGPRIVAESPLMRRMLELLVRAAASDAPVLLIGESGTGKELLAREIHERSPRQGRPFIAVNCSAIPDTLLESHLFGHRRGAFTDAREDRNGLFRDANGGTILLDEIGDMPPLLQSKLLRVLQEKEIHPLGASAPVPVDVRVVAATHRDLEALIESGRFRLDLYYRLKVVVVRVPPLRERPEDMLPLVAHFLEKHGKRAGRPGCTLTSEAMEILRSHGWPGNVRELENTIERCLVLGPDDLIDAADLPADVRPSHLVRPRGAGVHSMAEIKREHIQRALHVAGGNKSAAARILGVDRKTLYSKIKLYGIQTGAIPRPQTPHP